MARKPQPDTGGSQFFITHNETPHLDGGYSVFGKVSKGQEVVDSIRVGDKIRIAGHTTDLKQAVESMEIDGQQVDEATAGAQIGIKVDERCRDNE